MKVKKKPVEVNAWPIRQLCAEAGNNWRGLPRQVAEAYERGDIVFRLMGIDIATLEGNMHGDLSDWLICGVKGEFYPCKPDIFEATYEGWK